MKKKMNGKKGFTLMEMLIVVAIIAVLVAIAIPTFTSSLTKAKCAADNANVRAAYAEAISDCLANGATATRTVGPMQAAWDGTVIGSVTPTSWSADSNVKVTATDTNGVISVTIGPST